MFHLKGASSVQQWSRHCPPLFFGSQQLRMASAISYTRKRRKGLSGSSSELPIAAASVEVKHEFDKFQHVVKKLESTPRKVKKEEDGGAALEVHEDRVLVKDEICGGESKPTIRADVAAGERGCEALLRVHEDRVFVKDEICSSGGGESKPTIRADVAAEEGGCEALLKAVDAMVVALAPLTFKAPVAFVYNPLEYARSPHEEYVRKYGGKKVDVLLVGMNPGPFGMAQTGVPFGDSVLVREFLHITSEVEPPEEMHPKRPIIGLKCPRREVSGQRLWGWAQARFGTASAFLDRFWIHNYCPLMFMEPSGKNRTPDKLTITERASIISICNIALRAVIDVTNPRLIVGIGKYAGERVKQCAPPGVQVGDIMHPSPANPKANKDWDKLIEAQLRALGVDI